MEVVIAPCRMEFVAIALVQGTSDLCLGPVSVDYFFIASPSLKKSLSLRAFLMHQPLPTPRCVKSHASKLLLWATSKKESSHPT